jgi:RHS repeat-associated protein
MRLQTTFTTRIANIDQAFAPYGELYNKIGGNGPLNFTGDLQDIFAGLYDTPNRELMSNAGRWLSPDPTLASWNAYGYSTNPNSFVDPLGLSSCVFGSIRECRPGRHRNSIRFDGYRTDDLIQDLETLYLDGRAGYWQPTGDDGGSVWIPSSFPSLLTPANNVDTTLDNTANAANNCVKPNAAQRAWIKVLTAAANWMKTTIGVGLGASYGLGFGQGAGIAGTISGQLQVSPGGSASLVYTWGGSGLTEDWLTPSSYGASFIFGPQVSFSSGPPSSGPGADIAVSGVLPLRGPVGPGGSIDVDGSDTGVTGTLTGGIGAGIASGSAVVTQTTVVPVCR